MLPKSQRLTRLDIEDLLKKGKRFPSPFFQIVYRKAEKPSVAVVIAKKVEKSSVGRHQLKRKFMILLEKTGLVEAVVVYILQKSILTASPEEITSELERFKKSIQ